MLYRREGFPGEDELVLCTVTKVLPHVVFVNIDEYDKGGLVHISEIAPGRIRNIREYVELGKKIVCKVLRVDEQKGHIDLSLRRVSEIERKKKLEEIKQEQKAEKIVEMVAQQSKRKVNEVYETLTSKVFERYPFVHLFFREVASGQVQASQFIADNELAQIFQGVISDRFKPAKVSIKGTFSIKSFAPNGVAVVKSAFEAGQKKAKKTAVISLVYIGGGKYKIVVEAENYKDAEQTLKAVEDCVTTSILEQNGEVQFVREESA